jgi:leader peptidase (prepilin peptidase) / N-methyltransferase
MLPKGGIAFIRPVMESYDLLIGSPVLFFIIVGLVGLLVGSFLNVVIYRLPVMMQQSWRKECTEYLGLEGEPQSDEPFNLVFPLSRCPGCNTPIQPYQNIPVISYIFLKGKCAKCANPISLRYPIIEAFTALTSFIIAWHFGFTLQTGCALFLTWSLIALSFIDIDHHLLPDSITLPVLWLGLFLSVFDLFTDSHASIIVAVAGYLVLWSIFHLFKLLTGKEGMGYGDFKLLSLFGAWLGWQALPAIILLSSLVGAVVGIAMIVFARHDRNTHIPFGPYLAAAGWIALIWGADINQFYMKIAGL